MNDPFEDIYRFIGPETGMDKCKRDIRTYLEGNLLSEIRRQDDITSIRVKRAYVHIVHACVYDAAMDIFSMSLDKLGHNLKGNAVSESEMRGVIAYASHGSNPVSVLGMLELKLGWDVFNLPKVVAAAAVGGSVDVVTYLLSHGARLSASTYVYAAASKNVAILHALDACVVRQHGRQIPRDYGLELSIAARSGCTAVYTHILKQCKDKSMRAADADRIFREVVASAVASSNTFIIITLLQSGLVTPAAVAQCAFDRSFSKALLLALRKDPSVAATLKINRLPLVSPSTLRAFLQAAQRHASHRADEIATVLRGHVISAGSIVALTASHWPLVPHVTADGDLAFTTSDCRDARINTSCLQAYLDELGMNADAFLRDYTGLDGLPVAFAASLADAEATDKSLMACVSAGDIIAAHLQLKKNPAVCADAHLVAACESGDVAMLETLLYAKGEYGADVIAAAANAHTGLNGSPLLSVVATSDRTPTPAAIRAVKALEKSARSAFILPFRFKRHLDKAFAEGDSGRVFDLLNLRSHKSLAGLGLVSV